MTLFPQIIFALYTNLWYYVSGRYSYLIIETVPFIHHHRIDFTISLYIWAVLAHFFYAQGHVRKYFFVKETFIWNLQEA